MILLQVFLGLCIICVVGFIGQWLCWEVFPFWKDKRQAKKEQRKKKKLMK